MISKKWLQRSCLTVFCLLVFSGWSGRLWAGAADTVTVTIEQAEKTEYLKDADSGEEVIRFTGDVSLTVDNQGTKTVIQAETVTFNRARATVYASGNVQFTQTGDGRNTETLTAQSLLFNTRTLEGVFDNGRVVQESSGNINLPTGSVLVVFAESFGRENSGTVTFRSGSLTFCDDPDPHWKIDASRIWLLPGNEFAIFSGFLYVGHFPVLYIPFFYYPKDEMIFNPSFGYDGRKGYFTQTTTYIIGRKGLSDSSSSEEDEGLFSFMKTTTLKEQEREGLFLHNLDADAVMPDNSLKILVDGYSNLGYMAGVEGSFKTAGNFSDIAFGSYIGMSRTLFPVNSFYGSYTTLSPTDQQYWDSGWFLGMRTPFRFGASVKTSYNNKPFSFTLSLPVYSDPYFTSDFLADRSESMDWINFLMNNVATGGNLASLADAGTSSTLSSYAWSLNGSVSTPQFISHLNPWVTEFSVSNTSSINFASKVNDSLSGETASYDPNRYFYYPSAVLPLKASMRIGGKL
ncbi:MAG: hypothetical protein MJ178_05180, partial [Treponemataceae bacterium]|nr:hypothetical protein [Treponemataceae bacterium]